MATCSDSSPSPVPSSVSSPSMLSPSTSSYNMSPYTPYSRVPTLESLHIETASVTRHSQYHISSGDVVFQVENQLFRVHRYFFVRESDYFRDMLCMQSSTGTELEGHSDARPIELPEVTAIDFARFVWVFYDQKYQHDASIEEWASILHLAHKWSFAEVKQLAIRKLEALDVMPVDKAVWAFHYDVGRDWLATAYAALGARATPLTKAEGVRLGLDVVLKLAEVREKIRDRRHAPRQPPSKPVEENSRSRSRRIKVATMNRERAGGWGAMSRSLSTSRSRSPSPSPLFAPSPPPPMCFPPSFIPSSPPRIFSPEPLATHSVSTTFPGPVPTIPVQPQVLAKTEESTNTLHEIDFTDEDLADVRSVFGL